MDIGNLAEDPFDCTLEAPLTGDVSIGYETKDHDPHQHDEFSNAKVEANKIRDKVPIWGMVPTFCPPMCPMDVLVLTLIEQRKKHANLDENNEEFANSNFPSVNSLLNPVLYEPDKPVASTIARHVASVIRVHTTPEKIAVSN